MRKPERLIPPRSHKYWSWDSHPGSFCLKSTHLTTEPHHLSRQTPEAWSQRCTKVIHEIHRTFSSTSNRLYSKPLTIFNFHKGANDLNPPWVNIKGWLLSEAGIILMNRCENPGLGTWHSLPKITGMWEIRIMKPEFELISVELQSQAPLVS